MTSAPAIVEEEAKGSLENIAIRKTQSGSASYWDRDTSRISVPRKHSRVIAEFTHRSHELSSLTRRISTGKIVSDAEKVKFSFELENFHSVSISELLSQFQSDESNGIDEDLHAALLKRYGENILAPPKELPIYIQFLFCFVSGFAPLLWISAGFVFLSWRPFGAPPSNMYNLALAIVLLGVIFISGMLTFYQDVQTASVLTGFSKLLPVASATVFRSGRSMQVDPKNLVPGDVVVLNTGVRVPADMRVLSGSFLKMDKSMLTGESEPVKLAPDAVDANIHLLQSPNMAFMGCNITDGQGLGVVIATGKVTQLAKIASQVVSVGSPKTSLQKDINRFVSIIITVALSTVSVVVLVWAFYLRVAHHLFMNTSAMMSNAIGVLVAFVPEGLPLALSMGLTLIAHRLCSQHSILVKQLGTIETVGSMSMLCTDKTGTLTQNKMTVRNVIASAILMPVDAFSSSDKSTDLVNQVSQIAVLCNQSKMAATDGTDDFHINADAEGAGQRPARMTAAGSNGIDQALLNWAYSQNIIEKVLKTWNVRTVMAFNSTAKLAAVVASSCNVDTDSSSDFSHTAKSIRQSVVMVKGAPEHIMHRCVSYTDKDGSMQPISEEFFAATMSHIATVSGEGQRVIGMAKLILSDEDFPSTFEYVSEPSANFPLDRLCFVACIAVSDPPREGVREAILKMRTAGIKIAMVTGDAAPTAVAIAAKVSIVSNSENVGIFANYLLQSRSSLSAEPCMEPTSLAVVVEGKEVDDVDDKGWDFIFKHRELIFARATPENKLNIVKEAQKRGNRVGVTGDGVNDSPALKRADVGIAMSSGSDVARDAADIVLLKDNFTAVAEGVLEGRLIFTNLRKVIAYLISAGAWAELMPVLATFFLGMPTPLSPFLMIVISCLTDVYAGVALTCERPEKGIMTEAPRHPVKSPLVDLKLIVYSYLFYGTMECVGAFYNYFHFMYYRGPVSSEQKTFPAGYSPNQLIGAWTWESGSQGALSEDQKSARIEASSVFFVALIVAQWGHLISIRRKTPYFSDAIMGSDYNEEPGMPKPSLMVRIWREIQESLPRWTILAAIVCSALTAVFVNEVPAIQQYCGTGTVPAKYWGFSLGWSLAWFILGEVRKWIILLYPCSAVARLTGW